LILLEGAFLGHTKALNMKVSGLPVLAREDERSITVFYGQIIVPRDPAVYTIVSW